MTFDVPTGNEIPGSVKPFPASLLSLLNITGQFTFTEFQRPVGTGNSIYQILLVDAGSNDLFSLGMSDNGGLSVQVGPVASVDTYSGTWVPNNGTHKVHFTVDSLGVPRLWIDGVEVVLVFAGNGPGSPTTADSVTFLIGDFNGSPTSAPVSSVFVTTGNLPPTTVFCCPL